MLTLAGPSSRLIAQRLSHADLGGAAFAYMTARWIDLGHAPVLALRAGYVGELGWEFHVPAEYVRDLYDRLVEAGADAGLRDVGYRAVNSLRLEKQYVAWAADVRSDDNPYAAGLGFAVRPDKPGLLAGPALRKIRDEGPAERLCWFSADADVVMHGGELLAHLDHDCAASVRSAGLATPSAGPSSPPTCPPTSPKRRFPRPRSPRRRFLGRRFPKPQFPGWRSSPRFAGWRSRPRFPRPWLPNRRPAAPGGPAAPTRQLDASSSRSPASDSRPCGTSPRYTTRPAPGSAADPLRNSGIGPAAVYECHIYHQNPV